MELINKIIVVLSDNGGAIVSVGMVLFGIAKAVSNEKASQASGVLMGAIVKLQKIVDAVSQAIALIGVAIAKLSDLLSQIVKSDGFLGKK